jgi:hypothetical protein
MVFLTIIFLPGLAFVFFTGLMISFVFEKLFGLKL